MLDNTETPEAPATKERLPSRRGVTLSDLHLFSDYAEYANSEAFERLLDHTLGVPGVLPSTSRERYTPNADVCVLNGDIFEFEKPSARYSQQEMVDNAIDWMRKLVTRHPKTEFHYIFGNHDAVESGDSSLSFARRMHELADELSAEGYRFTVHDVSCVIGCNALFTHGDIPLRNLEMEQPRQFMDAEKARYPDDLTLTNAISGSLQNDPTHNLETWFNILAYKSELVHKLFLGLAAVHNHHTRITPVIAENLAETLSNMQNVKHKPVHIFTGHTHLPVENLKYKIQATDAEGQPYEQKFRFHNTGSGVRMEEFNMLEFEIKTSRITPVDGGKPYIRERVKDVRLAREIEHFPRYTRAREGFTEKLSRATSGISNRNWSQKFDPKNREEAEKNGHVHLR